MLIFFFPFLQVVSDGADSQYIYRVLTGRVRVEKGDAKTSVGQGAVLHRLYR